MRPRLCSGCGVAVSHIQSTNEEVNISNCACSELHFPRGTRWFPRLTFASCHVYQKGGASALGRSSYLLLSSVHFVPCPSPSLSTQQTSSFNLQAHNIFNMLYKSLALTAVAATSVLAQTRPANVSICDWYTTALLKENTAENQLKVLTLVVNTAVIGNCTFCFPLPHSIKLTQVNSHPQCHEHQCSRHPRPRSS